MQKTQSNKSFSLLMVMALLFSIIALIALSTISLWLPNLLFKNVVSVSDNVLDTQEKIIFDSLTRKISDLELRLEQAEDLQKTTQSNEKEIDLSALSPVIEAMSTEQDELKKLYDQLDRKINTSSSSRVKLTDLQESLNTQNHAHQDLNDQVAYLNQAVTSYLENEGKFSSYILIIAQFKKASTDDGLFLAEFNRLYQILETDQDKMAFEAIRPYASQGLPTIEKIQNDYNEKINAIIELNLLPSNQSWVQKLNGAIKSLIRVKPTSINEGDNSVTTLLLQAQNLMQANYHDAALQKLDMLPDSTKEELGQTYYQYQARIQISALLKKLNENIIDKLTLIHTNKQSDQNQAKHEEIEHSETHQHENKNDTDNAETPSLEEDNKGESAQ